MRYLFFIAVLFFVVGLAGVQAQSAVSEQFTYDDWTHRSLAGDGEINLRKFAAGKKLVLVAYWAPWCPDWKNNAALVQQLHEKYGDKGLGVIGVGNYDTVAKMQAHYSDFKLTFPSVYESESSAARTQSPHYEIRSGLGDNRRWGTPLYIFIDTSGEKHSEGFAVKRADVFFDNLAKDKVESFVEEKLGLKADSK